MDYNFESELISNGYEIVCGVDEAGRGPLCGPVCAAACILPCGLLIEGLNDSKKLSEKKREKLYDVICKEAVAYSVAFASVDEIDELNILEATLLAMRRAVEGLSVSPDYLLIDGNCCRSFNIPAKAVIKGDALVPSIAAASILAKVTRDRLCMELDKEYPQYNIAKHKGYGTKEHMSLIREHGISPIHRKSFIHLDKPAKNKMNELTTKNTGDIGEFQACRYLESQGYTIKARNVHVSKKEIDIIAEKDDLIAFVEVKTRTFSSRYKQPYTYARPAEAVNYKKRMNTIEAALGYVYKNNIEKRIRFDVCEIYFAEYPDKTYKLHKLNYIDNAFDIYGNIT